MHGSGWGQSFYKYYRRGSHDSRIDKNYQDSKQYKIRRSYAKIIGAKSKDRSSIP